jgi:hypothetical protein
VAAQPNHLDDVVPYDADPNSVNELPG